MKDHIFKLQTRESTKKLSDMISDGLLDRDQVIIACLNYMSEDEVADMCRVNGFFDFEEEDKEE